MSQHLSARRFPRMSLAAQRVSFLCLGAALLTGCGSSNRSAQPATQDFAITVSPSSLTQQAGGAASTFTISVTGQNSFTGPVSISLSGLPAASTTSPASAFTIAAGASQTVTLSVPASVAAGNFTLMAKGTSGTLTHSAPLPLIVHAPLTALAEPANPTPPMSCCCHGAGRPVVEAAAVVAAVSG